MMKIHTLTRSTGLKDKARQRGRWDSSGRGNYSGKGYKGQKSRTGFSLKPYFEWGQTSVVMRMPKARGFKRYYKLQDVIYPINLCILEKDVNIKDGSEITKELLKTCGYIKKATNMVKILGTGDFAKKLTFKGIEKFSATAKEKIEKAGGKIE